MSCWHVKWIITVDMLEGRLLHSVYFTARQNKYIYICIYSYMHFTYVILCSFSGSKMLLCLELFWWLVSKLISVKEHLHDSLMINLMNSGNRYFMGLCHFNHSQQHLHTAVNSVVTLIMHTCCCCVHNKSSQKS